MILFATILVVSTIILVIYLFLLTLAGFLLNEYILFTQKRSASSTNAPGQARSKNAP